MRIRPKDVPSDAIGRTFVSGSKKGDYWVWPHGKTYYWQSCGNNGEEETWDDAAEAARRWIRGDK